MIFYFEKEEIMSIKFRNVLNEKLKGPAFKKEFDAIESEFSMIRALIAARKWTYSKGTIRVNRYCPS